VLQHLESRVASRNRWTAVGFKLHVCSFLIVWQKDKGDGHFRCRPVFPDSHSIFMHSLDCQYATVGLLNRRGLSQDSRHYNFSIFLSCYLSPTTNLSRQSSENLSDEVVKCLLLVDALFSTGFENCVPSSRASPSAVWTSLPALSHLLLTTIFFTFTSMSTL